MKRMERTKEKGVYQYVSETERYEGKPDVCYYFTYKQDGKKKWVKVGWKSEKIKFAYAVESRRKFMEGLRKGENPASETDQVKRELTYGAGWKTYEAKWVDKEIANPDDFKSRYRVHIKSVFEQRKIRSITNLDLEDFKNALFDKGLSASSVRLILADMRAVIKKLTLWEEYVGQNPFDKFNMPKVENDKIRFLNEDEVHRLFIELKKRSEKWYWISALSLHTGARLSEVLALKVKDVDLKNGIMTVKGKTGRRTLALNTFAIEVLEEALSHQKEIVVFPKKTQNSKTIEIIAAKTGLTVTEACRLHLCDVDLEKNVIYQNKKNTIVTLPIVDSIKTIFEEHIARIDVSLLFIGQTGKQIRNDATKNSFARAAKAAGLNPPGTDDLDKATFHTLRHTYCSWLVQAGVEIFAVSRLVGHKSTAMTERYSHLSPQARDRAASIMEKRYSTPATS